MGEMFCFQCQQTAHNTGCEGKAGVCGKKADTANFQDELVSELIGLSAAVWQGKRSENTDELMLKGLFTTITNVNFNSDTVKKLISEIQDEKNKISDKIKKYDISDLWSENEDIRSLKSLILFGLKRGWRHTLSTRTRLVIRAMM